MNINKLPTQDREESSQRIRLVKSIYAVRVAGEESASGKLGLLAQLGAGTTLEPCGEGFNERTVTVRVDNQRYFVFLQDLESQATAASSQL